MNEIRAQSFILVRLYWYWLRLIVFELVFRLSSTSHIKPRKTMRIKVSSTGTLCGIHERYASRLTLAGFTGQNFCGSATDGADSAQFGKTDAPGGSVPPIAGNAVVSSQARGSGILSRKFRASVLHENDQNQVVLPPPTTTTCAPVSANHKPARETGVPSTVAQAFA